MQGKSSGGLIGTWQLGRERSCVAHEGLSKVVLRRTLIPRVHTASVAASVEDVHWRFTCPIKSLWKGTLHPRSALVAVSTQLTARTCHKSSYSYPIFPSSLCSLSDFRKWQY